jgi:hypothetical protein
VHDLAGLGVPVGAEQRDPAVRQRTAKEVEESEGVGVRPVQVVQDDEQPSAAARVIERGHHLLEQTETVHAVVPATVGDIPQVAAFRNHAQLTKHLGPHPVRRRAQRLDRPPPGHIGDPFPRFRRDV